MKRAAGWALVAALVATFAINATWVAKNWRALQPVAGGAEAPAIALPLLDGGNYRLAGGHVTVVDFWASWCPPCRAELPSLDRLAARYRGRGVEVVAVNVEAAEAADEVKAFVRSTRLALPVAMGGGEVAEAYRVEALPTVVIVDGNRRVRRVFDGPADEAELVAAIEAARY